jgi:CcmD family protein
MQEPAAEKPSTSNPSERSTEFVAVPGGGETTSAEGLLVAAYLVMWALLIGFIFLSWRRQQRVETRISELEKALGVSSGKSAAG